MDNDYLLLYLSSLVCRTAGLFCSILWCSVTLYKWHVVKLAERVISAVYWYSVVSGGCCCFGWRWVCVYVALCQQSPGCGWSSKHETSGWCFTGCSQCMRELAHFQCFDTVDLAPGAIWKHLSFGEPCTTRRTSSKEDSLCWNSNPSVPFNNTLTDRLTPTRREQWCCKKFWSTGKPNSFLSISILAV